MNRYSIIKSFEPVAKTPMTTSETSNETSHETLAELADMFHLMGDPTRLAILLACLDRPRAVGDVAVETGASASLVSHHLRLLRAARLVRAERRGRQIFYLAADAHIRDMLRDMVVHAGEPQLTIHHGASVSSGAATTARRRKGVAGK
jgi:DNA-binding transcriptional ArsR family regulator